MCYSSQIPNFKETPQGEACGHLKCRWCPLQIILVGHNHIFWTEIQTCHLTHNLKLRQGTWNQDRSEPMWVFCAKSCLHPHPGQPQDRFSAPHEMPVRLVPLRCASFSRKFSQGNREAPSLLLPVSPAVLRRNQPLMRPTDGTQRELTHPCRGLPPWGTAGSSLIPRVNTEMIRSGLPTL